VFVPPNASTKGGTPPPAEQEQAGGGSERFIFYVRLNTLKYHFSYK